MDPQLSDPDNPFEQFDYGPNPFAPYADRDANADSVARTLTRSAIRAPAICLLVLSLLTVPVAAVAVVINIAWVLDEGLDLAAGLPFYIGSAIMVLLNVAIAWGMICMLRLRRWNTARLAAIVALIPLCSPLYVLGIPFGIWALVVLNRAETKAEFQS